ncbi:hypothetical protein QCA50_019560 [Cerrena zonata]|uniref:Uncharacterized protein n=1 Tax=Cerrena zonata TaxID=2478898 RepID=A0AAW0FE16_9APHY
MMRKPSTASRPSERASSLSRRDTIRPSSKQRGVKKNNESEKFKVRHAKILRMEQEQMLEDDIAVKIIQGLHLSSIMPFDNVQTEFHDLDGLTWARPLPQPRRPYGLPTRSSALHATYSTQHNGPPRGSFTHSDLADIALRLSKELKFPNISLSNQTLAEAAFACMPNCTPC